jgi:hypothetical protein
VSSIAHAQQNFSNAKRLYAWPKQHPCLGDIAVQEVALRRWLIGLSVFHDKGTKLQERVAVQPSLFVMQVSHAVVAISML